jgi:hypothetical protein
MDFATVLKRFASTISVYSLLRKGLAMPPLTVGDLIQ